jgi:hypothetical protein
VRVDEPGNGDVLVGHRLENRPVPRSSKVVSC